jgi:hypothetical protein
VRNPIAAGTDHPVEHLAGRRQARAAIGRSSIPTKPWKRWPTGSGEASKKKAPVVPGLFSQRKRSGSARRVGLILWHWLIAIAGRSCESSKALRLTAAFFGDPLPGMSALDRRRRNEVAH